MSGPELHPSSVRRSKFKEVVFLAWEYLYPEIWCTVLASLPPANEVWGKVIFLHLFVILFTGGCLPGPGGAWSQEGCLVLGLSFCSQGRGGAWSWGAWSGGYLLWGGGAWWRPPHSHCCRRYASYWNAFLFVFSCLLFFAHIYIG